jgi:hypothetical protein
MGIMGVDKKREGGEDVYSAAVLGHTHPGLGAAGVAWPGLAV